MSFRTPQCRRHVSGQATVHIKGKVFYLGKYGTPESTEAYRRIINESLARKEMPPVKTLVEGPYINEIVLAFLKFAQGYYVKNGPQTQEVEKITYALQPLKNFYGNTPAQSFDVPKLKAVMSLG